MAQPLRKQAGIMDVEFGDDVVVVEPANLYGCKIGGGGGVLSDHLLKFSAMRLLAVIVVFNPMLSFVSW